MFKRATAIVAALFFAGGVQAATLNEADIAGGFAAGNQNFNPDYTAVAYGFDTVVGTLTANNFDFLQFTDLDAGAQTISLTLELLVPSGAGYSNGGGELRYSEAYQSSPYGGTFGGNFALEVDPFNLPGTPSATLSFNLGSSFAGGDLFLALIPQYGNQTISYTTTLTGNGGSTPAPVPVPATGLLLLGALAVGMLALRRSAPHLVGA
ncbi:MAG: hypothetical protein AAFQ64_01835 [Pseudomonadota bacterium]